MTLFFILSNRRQLKKWRSDVACFPPKCQMHGDFCRYRVPPKKIELFLRIENSRAVRVGNYVLWTYKQHCPDWSQDL